MDENNESPTSIARKQRKLILMDKKYHKSDSKKENVIGAPSIPVTTYSHLHHTTSLTDVVNASHIIPSNGVL